jgi:hypothetical protein
MPVICLPELCLLKRSWPILSRFTFLVDNQRRRSKCGRRDSRLALGPTMQGRDLAGVLPVNDGRELEVYLWAQESSPDLGDNAV